MDRSSIEIVVVGNELLNGTTLDTNSFWLSKILLEMGGQVKRKITVQDEISEIVGAFRSSLERSPAWIFSLGGLGPTFDDMTLRGLAKALNRGTERSPEAVKMIKASRELRIREGAKLPRKLSLTILKMAELPKGAIPLQNSVGAAPGILVKLSSTNIVSLPGVPREMKAIFKEQVSPMLKAELPKIKKREKWLEAKGIPESTIAPKIKNLMKEYAPSIYIKSHPLSFKSGISLLEFQVSVTSLGDDEPALNLLKEVTQKLKEESEKLGAKVRAKP